MSLFDRASLALLHQFDPEKAHNLALYALRAGLTPRPGPITSPRLACEISGIKMPNPIGLAAGFDKNGKAIHALGHSGFGWLEIGAATPKPQSGNPKPRLFRLPEDEAIINRFGFNNEGIDSILPRVIAAKKRTPIPIGLNLGANKTSEDRVEDYVFLIVHAGAWVDFATINISSPNTAGLRGLQTTEALEALLDRVLEAKKNFAPSLPLFLKLAPDLSFSELAAIAGLEQRAELAGIIATNTTLSRSGLLSPLRTEQGGLSGRPLKEKSLAALSALYRLTEGKTPLIGVGGIGSAWDAYERIAAGASVVQIYSALIYKGIGLAARIARELDEIMEMKGFASIDALRGSSARK